ncbi:CynX/NimT family MFS transporter [Staphylococcus pseudintermedius]|uniref:CynX/NimT family MFS transporter n=1 Tax=Staphylococcus pseudintermedius TaxID=283734 RepID=UPI001BDEA0C7|nr:MFS transporter [Staphylococcus pseudintermedius]EJJ6354960.1 MFS transporter [Staphylococcus pseudintermedius]MDK3918336.1 MFS transporter [Staphylococcus pseudintermedius]
MEKKTYIFRIQDHWWIVIGIILVASTLRAPLTSVGPVIEGIKGGLHINNALAGLLTTIPLVIFGMVSLFVARTMAHMSMANLVTCAMLLLIVGLMIRILGTIEFFIVGTMIIGVAIAYGNVILPSYAKWLFPTQIGMITGIYSATMNFTAGLGGGLSYPLSQIGSLGYKASLGFWILLCICALIVWRKHNSRLSIDQFTPSKNEPKKRSVQRLKVSRTPLAWAIALTMGFQSMIFYVVVAWLPSIVIDRGLSPSAAGYYFMLNQFAQVPMTFTFPIIASKMKSQSTLVWIIFILYMAGFITLLTLPVSLLFVSMIILGLSLGAAFSICMTFFSIRANTSDGSVALSGFGQSIGYIVAASGPFVIGTIHDIANGWRIPLILVMMMACGFLFVGLISSKDRYIEEYL